MTHFAVLVVGQDYASQLAPFHEFECTGVNDEHVVEVDITAKARAKFAEARRDVIQLPSGELVDAWSDRFFRDPTKAELALIGPFGGALDDLRWTAKDWGDGRGYRPKIKFVPAGAKELQVEHESFLAWVKDWYGVQPLAPLEVPDLNGEHKFGHVKTSVDGGVLAVIDRTNPNAKWDWYQVGGRWRGFFKARGMLGEASWANEGTPVPADRADRAYKRDIDVASMRLDAARKAGATWVAVRAVIDRHPPIRSWSAIQAECGIIDSDPSKWPKGALKTARDIYHGQPGVQALGADADLRWIDDPEQCQIPRANYESLAARRALCTFAYVKDRQWHERGRMGGWAPVHEDHDPWAEEVNAMFDALPGDTVLTVVDCHI